MELIAVSNRSILFTMQELIGTMPRSVFNTFLSLEIIKPETDGVCKFDGSGRARR